MQGKGPAMGLFARRRAPSGPRGPGADAPPSPRPVAPVPDVDDRSAPFEETIRDQLARLTAAAESDIDALTPEQLDAALTSRLVGAGRVHATGLGFSYAVPFADGIDEVLTLDLPDAVVTLPDARVAELGRYLPALLALGRANLLRLLETTPVDVERLGAGAASCVLASGDSPYTASFARFLLDAVATWLPEADTSNGVVFALPDRHGIVLQTCGTPADTRAALDLVPWHAARLFGEGVGPVSPHAFHWHQQCVTRLTHESAAGALVVRSTPFLEALLGGGRRRAG